MKESISLTLIVCVADDQRIEKLLKSVDLYCEVIIVLNGATEQVKKIVNSFKNSIDFNLVLIEIPDRNLSMARNIGIESASNSKVVFYDSDCTIERGALKEFYTILEKALLVDGKVIFKRDNFQSKIISIIREFGIPGYALCPAIGINKKIKPMIKNYFFDVDICWIEDFELNIRAKESAIAISTIESVTCIHDNLTFKQDLRSAYRYGVGIRNAVKKRIYKRGPDGNWYMIPPIMKRSILSGLYYIIWNIVYCIGYYTNKKI